MADHQLDAIVHKAVEHQPTLIKDGIAPPFVDQKGAPHLNTFLVFVPTIVVPAGFTRDNLARRALLYRPALRRRQSDQICLFVRTGDASSQAAREHDGTLIRLLRERGDRPVAPTNFRTITVIHDGSATMIEAAPLSVTCGR